MVDIYTHTTWHVKPGSRTSSRSAEESGQIGAIDRGWALTHDFSGMSTTPIPSSASGAWGSVEAARGWRSLPGYQERVARLQDVVESFEPRTLHLIADR